MQAKKQSGSGVGLITEAYSRTYCVVPPGDMFDMLTYSFIPGILAKLTQVPFRIGGTKILLPII